MLPQQQVLTFVFHQKRCSILLTLHYRYDNYYYDDPSSSSSSFTGDYYDDAVIIEGRNSASNRQGEEHLKLKSRQEEQLQGREREEDMTRDQWIRNVLNIDPDQPGDLEQQERLVIQYPVLVHHAPFVVWPHQQFYHRHQQQPDIFYSLSPVSHYQVMPQMTAATAGNQYQQQPILTYGKK